MFYGEQHVIWYEFAVLNNSLKNVYDVRQIDTYIELQQSLFLGDNDWRTPKEEVMSNMCKSIEDLQSIKNLDIYRKHLLKRCIELKEKYKQYRSCIVHKKLKLTQYKYCDECEFKDKKAECEAFKQAEQIKLDNLDFIIAPKSKY